MNLLWLPVLRPLCKALAPEIIVEIGADTGLNTRNILSYCSYFGATLYSIDPAPKFDAAAWERQYGRLFHFLPLASLEALPRIPKFDLVLADGDHNYHTVYQELKIIEKLVWERDQAFPCILCHDIGWPYGRRDLYYNPETIPAQARKPYARKGIKMNQSELAETGGLNAHLCHSTEEGTPHNGVLTAIEDFLKESAISFDLIKIPSLYGLGILIPEELKARNPRVKEFAARWHIPEHLGKLLATTEEYRLQSELHYHEQRGKYQQLLERMKSIEKSNTALKDELCARELAARKLKAELEQARGNAAVAGQQLQGKTAGNEETSKMLAREQRAEQLAGALEELERQAARRESALEELKRQYHEAHAARMRLQCAAQEHDERLDAIRRRTYTAELCLAAEKGQTGLLREELDRLRARAAADAQERSRLESRIQSQQALLRQHQGEADALWQELFDMEERLCEERTARSDAEKTLDLAHQDLEQAVGPMRDALLAERDRLAQALEIARRDHAERQMEIEALNHKLREMAARQTERDAQNRSGEKRIAKLTDRVIARDQQLREYEHRWKEERAKGGHLHGQNQQLEQKLAELTETQKQLRAQLRLATGKAAEYEDQIQHMKNRPAWRLIDFFNRSPLLTKTWLLCFKGLGLVVPALRPAKSTAAPAALPPAGAAPGEAAPAAAKAISTALNGKGAPAANGRAAAPAVDLSKIHGTIVVCVRDALEDVKACLESLRRHTDLKKHRLLLVDDGSDQATRDLLERFHRETGVSILSTPANARGYTRAANTGLRAASGDFVILLNSDTIVPAGWIDRMVACAFSAPDIAVVGPLSNAASWQSIPELRDAEGKWCINKLPEGISVDEYARSIAEHSPRLYPEVTFVNGFCYLITRQAIEKVGLLDETTFPMGYGEEDDFSFRSQQAGMRCLIADDAYVFHAKSKSFTAEVRAKIVETAKPKLANKHGRELITRQIERIAANEALLRARVMARIMADQGTRAPLQRHAKRPQTIGWIQPHLGTVGGIRRVIEMSNRLVQWGHRVFLVTPDGEKTAWLPIMANVITFEKARQMHFDCLMVSDPDVCDLFHDMPAPLKINYHLAAYMVYREKTEKLGLYYNHDRAVVHLANSHWTAEQIESSYGDIKVAAVLPGGIDKRLFHPVRTPAPYDLVYYGSKRKHKGTPTIVAAAKSLKMNGLSLSTLGASQEELAQHICSGRIFASACWHEGFNFCPLEAMACGVPVVMTDDGGSREYARDGENALVVPPQDEAAFAKALARLHKDQDLRLQFIEQGLETAYRYNWDDITVELDDIIEQRLR